MNFYETTDFEFIFNFIFSLWILFLIFLIFAVLYFMISSFIKIVKR